MVSILTSQQSGSKAQTCPSTLVSRSTIRLTGALRHYQMPSAGEL